MNSPEPRGNGRRIDFHVPVTLWKKQICSEMLQPKLLNCEIVTCIIRRTLIWEITLSDNTHAVRSHIVNYCLSLLLVLDQYPSLLLISRNSQESASKIPLAACFSIFSMQEFISHESFCFESRW